jgi:PAS domain-containing protein
MREPLSDTELAARITELEAQVAEQQQELFVLREIASLHQTLFDHLLYEVHVWELVRDEQGAIKTWRLLDANPAALNSWGKSREEVIGKLTDQIFPGANATEQFMPIVQEIFKTGQPHHWESHFPGTDQTLMMVTIPLGERFISSGVDVSPMKHVEAELKETLLKLQESIEVTKVGLWDWNIQTNEVSFSKEWKAQIGYADHEIQNNFDEWLSRAPP